MVIAWAITLPAAGIVGALCCLVCNAIGGGWGVAVMFVVLVVAAAAMYLRSRHTAITAANVNAEWQGPLTPLGADEAPQVEPANPS
jgi:PiT family inorganic phosphate transporter